MTDQLIAPRTAADVRQALSKLRTVASLQDLYDRATKAVCDYLGFDRAVVFRLQGCQGPPPRVPYPLRAISITHQGVPPVPCGLVRFDPSK